MDKKRDVRCSRPSTRSVGQCRGGEVKPNGFLNQPVDSDLIMILEKLRAFSRRIEELLVAILHLPSDDGRDAAIPDLSNLPCSFTTAERPARLSCTFADPSVSVFFTTKGRLLLPYLEREREHNQLGEINLPGKSHW
ncbi:hypothetical protein DTO271D3_1820 [Paecilomyces variotii]|nr:hypothetical protein DTO271D3_1820 [Paecilomyces variotii]